MEKEKNKKKKFNTSFAVIILISVTIGFFLGRISSQTHSFCKKNKELCSHKKHVLSKTQKCCKKK